MHKCSRLIDPVQAMHSRAGNGLPLLNLREPGEFCAEPSVCSIRCLVCGQAVMHGDDPEFEDFHRVCQGDAREVGAWAVIEYALEQKQAVLTSSWDTPVHRKCAEKAACKEGCWIPRGEPFCREHERPPRAVAREPSPAPVAMQRNEYVPAPAQVSRAEWFRPAGSGVRLELPEEPAPPKRRAPPPARTANKKLQAAASNTKSLQGHWASAAPAPKPARAYDAAQHQSGFDTQAHGYWVGKEGLFYVFPHGARVRASGVDEITPEGSLRPD